MNIILLFIPISLILLGVGMWVLFGTSNYAQFDNLDTPFLTPLSEDSIVERDTDES